MGALKDFLSTDKTPTDEMSREDLEAEVNGYRAMLNILPLEVIEWVCRLGEPFRVLTRKYEPKTGVLTNVKFEPIEYSLEILEPAFDTLRGCRLIEQKVITLGQDAVLYFEDVLESQDFEAWQEEQNLAQQSLDV